MRMSNSRVIAFGAFAAFFVLGFLLIKENGRANAAEAKVREFQYKMDSLSNDKAGLTTEFQNEIDALNAKLKDAAEKYEALMNQKNDELDRLGVQMQDESAKQEAALKERSMQMTALETKSKTDTDRSNAALAEKSAQISDLGSKLQELSTRLAAALKKNEAVESQNLTARQKIDALESSLKKLEQLHAKLLKVVQANQKNPAALD